MHGFVEDFIAGWGAGVCGLLVGHPFDTIKVKQQVLAQSRARKLVLSAIQSEGIYGLYKGMLFPLLASGTLNSLFFGVYANSLRCFQSVQHSKEDLKTCYNSAEVNKYWHFNVFLAGCLGGFAQFFLACPVDVIKVRLQAESTQVASGVQKRSSLRRCIKEIYQHVGPKGFYKGFGIMLARDIPASGIYVLCYEHLLALCQTALPFHLISCQFVAGGAAGTVSWIAILPMDVVKSRLQADNIHNPVYKGAIDCIIKIYRSNGPSVFFRGFWMTTCRAFPVNAATFIGYEWFLIGCKTIQRFLE